MWRWIRDKLPFLVTGAVLLALFTTGVLNWDTTEGWIRHYFFRAKGVAQNLGNTGPVGDTNLARLCRQNLERIQAAKRKAAFDRGQQVGVVTWEEVLRQLPEVPKRRLTPAEYDKFVPHCPAGGTYILGTLEEVPRCSIGGQNTLSLEDDHVIRG
jgi:hypothetical protein